MAHKVNAIRVEVRGDNAILTGMGQSPRGTKVRLRQAVAKGRKGDKEEFQKNVKKAIEEILGPSANV